MKNLILFLILFILVYIIYFIFVLSRKKMLKKLTNGKEVKYLIYKYKLDIKKINQKKLGHVVALSNAFILSTTVTLVSYFDNYIIQMLLGFVVLILLILITYHIVGTIYKNNQRKQGGK